MRRTASRALAAAVFTVAFWQVAAQAGELTSAETARRVDRLLADELFRSVDAPLAKGVDNVAFLRRVSLDLAGELPSPADVTRFALEPNSNKRADLVRRLLADPRYGRNWGRYWRDVILSRRSDERAMMTAESSTTYLSDALNRNVGWGKIARGFLTATGDVRENGQTALFMSQMGEVPETAAEASRIFLGVQIQCAQCHDHPTDKWKRAQFHELAAFFPRIAVRPVRDGMQLRSYEVVSLERGGGRRPGGGGFQPGGREHYMPDLKDPAARGTLMQPVFFLTGQKLETGASDPERRNALADWVTASSNPWFAKAFVNRVWAELVGEGFYEPIDDIGPERTCSAPRAMELLSSQFAAHDYDVKWLMATITSTEAYQRESRARRNPEQTPFLASCTQRLRADQLYDAVMAALGIEEGEDRGAGGYGPAQFRANQRSPRFQFNQVFGFDPSEPRDELAGSIPQALLLMNAPSVNRPIDGRRDTALGTLLAETKDDADVTLELYLRFLAREPSEAELANAIDYVKQTGNRTEAFEDLAWCLLNSTEFLHKK